MGLMSPVVFKPLPKPLPKGFSLIFSAEQHLRFKGRTNKPQYVKA